MNSIKDNLIQLTKTLRASWADLKSIIHEDVLPFREISRDHQYYYVENKVQWDYKEYAVQSFLNKEVIVAFSYHDTGSLEPKCIFRQHEDILYIAPIKYHSVFRNLAYTDYVITEINNHDVSSPYFSASVR